MKNFIFCVVFVRHKKNNVVIIIDDIKWLARLKRVKKKFLKNQRTMDRKGGKFSVKYFDQFTV